MYVYVLWHSDYFGKSRLAYPQKMKICQYFVFHCTVKVIRIWKDIIILFTGELFLSTTMSDSTDLMVLKTHTFQEFL